jgi:hypothetical protein
MLDRHRVRRDGLAAIALGGIAALIAVGPGGHSPVQTLDLASAPATDSHLRTPRFFASVSVTTGYRFRLELRSATTGRVTKTLTSLGGSWTNNGFALSPDGRYVYYTMIPRERRWKSLLLERISTSSRRRSLVGRGEQPALSPNGQLLAYSTGAGRSASIVIQNHSTGWHRRINVSRLTETHNDMLNALLAWQGDGRQLAVYEACCATLDASRTGHRPAAYVSRLIVISLARNGGLTATRLRGAGTKNSPESMGSDASEPNSVLVAPLLASDRSAVDRLTLGSPRARLRRLLTIGRSQVLSFDPTGRRLLYIQGHRPPNLWTARIAKHGLVRRHLLIRDSKLEAVAW